MNQNGSLIMKNLCFATLALLAVGSGCEVPELESPQVAAPAQSAAAPEPSLLEQAAHVDPEAYLPDGRVDMAGVKGEPPMTNGIPREVTAKDPKKGKLSRRAGGYLGSSMQAMPWAENETKFQMIKYNMEQYNAIKGYYPRSHEEFMEEYLPEFYPAALPLPELEPGDEYVYDPADHLLKIWRPAEATPDIRAKYLPTADTDQAQPAADAAQPAEGAESTPPEDFSIRGRAEALNQPQQPPAQ
jgi:hypothetical protein